MIKRNKMSSGKIDREEDVDYYFGVSDAIGRIDKQLNNKQRSLDA